MSQLFPTFHEQSGEQAACWTFQAVRMTEQTILIVDDDPKIRTLLRNVFQDDGFRVLEADNSEKALQIVMEKPVSLVTLDIHLGAEDGFDLAREIRRVSKVSIIMVTGKDDVIDRVVGLELGADDYITKPFHIREVLARVKSVLRRASGTQRQISGMEHPQGKLDEGSTRFVFDGMTAFPDRFELIDRNGDDCGLTGAEFTLLSVFLERPKRVLSRDQLMDLIGGSEWSPLDRTVDNQVARLRKKIERDPAKPKLIRTVRGVGYTFSCDVEQS